MWTEAELVRRGWAKLYHNVRVMRVQVDLLMRDPKGALVLIEVKTDGFSEMGHLTRGQARRLMRVCAFLAQWEPIELRLALVSGQALRLLPVDALTAL